MNRSLWIVAACALSGLVGCGNSPGPAANVCFNTPDPDHSATSLPVGLDPRPGPSALYLPPPARVPQLENAGVWTAKPILISGATAYRCGEFLYQDWLFDDHGAAGTADGADPQAKSAYLFSPKAGSLTYPTDPAYANNAADLVEFRVKPLGDATAFRLTLNTLIDAEKLAFTIALGDSPATVAWPHGANVSSPAEYFVTVHGATAEMIRAADSQVLAPAPTVAVDLERRQVEVRVPHAAWDPGQNVVRMAAGVGLWDVATGSYLQPGETASATAPGGMAALGAALFNVAFRSQEPMPDFAAFSGRTIADAAALSLAQANWWRERAQADALNLGDVSAFFAQVDFAQLASGLTDDSAVPVAGYMNRIFGSRNSFGQGVDYLKECGGVSPVYPCDGAMIGQLQPYSIYIPATAPPASGYGVTLLLHALSANYNQYLNSRHGQSLGDRGTGSIVITPAGRGPDGYYKDVAEADTFEVWADVARRYRLDPDWVAVTGVSMGGFGTFRLSTRYPDLFGRAMTIVASAQEYYDKLGSLHNVPLMMWTSAGDELQPVATTEPDITEALAQGLRLDVWRFTTWDHLSPSTNDYYPPAVEFLGEARVERNPARVRWWRNVAEDFPRVDAVASGAYWVSGIVLRDESLLQGEIDVVSKGFGVTEPVVLPVAMSTGTYSGGNLEPAPYDRRLQDWDAPAGAPVQNKLVIRATNIASAVIDPVRARVGCDAVLEIDSNGPIAIQLRGCP